MTRLLDVVTKYAMVYVKDDVELRELAESCPALFARKVAGYMIPAVTKFNEPPEMIDFLLGTEDDPKFSDPLFADSMYITEEEKTEPFTVELGEEYKGYELCSCRIRGYDDLGLVYFIPLNVTYDDETGTVTIPASEENPIPAETILDFDFYTDGYFSETLSREVMDILGVCFQYVWQDRFNTDYLSMIPKVDDKSFAQQNRANKENADSLRLRDIEVKLSGMMRKFSQNQWYKQVVRGNGLIF